MIAKADSLTGIRCFLVCCAAVLWLGPGVVAVAAEGKDRALDGLLAGGGPWELTKDAFEAGYKAKRFEWLSAAKEEARFAGSGLSLFGEDVGETIVRFHEGKVSRISISLYNRGDQGSLKEEKFEALLASWKEEMTGKIGSEPQDRGKATSSAVGASGYMWMSDHSAYLLEYSFQREVKTRGIPFEAQYVALKLAPKPKDDLLSRSDDRGPVTATKASLAKNVVKESNGDVLIPNVPMVDQGAKGYCVVSAVERVFRYYGRNVDQHQMAQLANASASGGTSISGMMGGLKQISGKFKVRVRAHEEFDFKDFQRMIDSYNREAKRSEKAREVHIPKSGVIDIGAIYLQVEPETFRTVRLKRSGFESFHRDIIEHVDEGIPLLWSVQLGMYPEEKLNPQIGGGHMRLIIGYNEGKGEYIFTDTWGAGHESKRMNAENAYAMTTGLFTVEPTR